MNIRLDRLNRSQDPTPVPYTVGVVLLYLERMRVPCDFYSGQPALWAKKYDLIFGVAVAIYGKRTSSETGV